MLNFPNPLSIMFAGAAGNWLTNGDRRARA